MIKKIALNTPGEFEFSPVSNMPEAGIGTLENFIQWGITMLLIVSALLALFFLIAGGIQWAASGGDKAAVETARKRIMYAVIGLVVVFLSFMIINTVGIIFNLDLLP